MLAFSHIQILNSDLTFSSTFGEKGSGRGELLPHDIAYDSTGKCIQVYTQLGGIPEVALRMFGRHGQVMGGGGGGGNG